MKRRGLKVTSSIYTSLFNSFANSPYPMDGLQRTRHLLSLMNEKNILPNEINCHAILKGKFLFIAKKTQLENFITLCLTSNICLTSIW